MVLILKKPTALLIFPLPNSRSTARHSKARYELVQQDCHLGEEGQHRACLTYSFYASRQFDHSGLNTITIKRL